MRNFVEDIALSVAFLSRLPMRHRAIGPEGLVLSRTVRAFPLAGLVIGLPSALLSAVLAFAVAPPLVAAGLVVVLQVMITGALHEDGLADTADGIGAGTDRERAIAIMHDSRTGVFAVVALVLTLILRVASIAALIVALPPLALLIALLAVAALSRGLMVWHWHILPNAHDAGLAARVGRPHPPAARMALTLGLILAVILLPVSAGPVATLVALVAGLLTLFEFTRRTRARLGGAAGDTIGAAQQLVETALLAGLAVSL